MQGERREGRGGRGRKEGMEVREGGEEREGWRGEGRKKGVVGE